MTYDEILDAPWNLDNDAGATNLRNYFNQLLMTVWLEGEDFSGKRPFGNSGWENEIYAHLVDIGVVKGEVDSDGLQCVDQKKADKLIPQLINHCF